MHHACRSSKIGPRRHLCISSWPWAKGSVRQPWVRSLGRHTSCYDAGAPQMGAGWAAGAAGDPTSLATHTLKDITMWIQENSVDSGCSRGRSTMTPSSKSCRKTSRTERLRHVHLCIRGLQGYRRERTAAGDAVLQMPLVMPSGRMVFGHSRSFRTVRPTGLWPPAGRRCQTSR